MDKSANSEEKRLIIVRLLGGLGNQMFQYALGRQLSLLHGRSLKLDLSHYQLKNTPWAARNYNLFPFNIAAEIASEEDIKQFKKYLRQSFVSRLLRRMRAFGQYYNRSYIFEPPRHNFLFDPRILSKPLKPVVYFDGFWQSEKYFKGIENIIRQDFTFKSPPDKQNQKLLEEIQTLNSCAIHVRHGDNATAVAAKHGVLPLNYYYQAVKDLSQKISNPRFYIFSDDPKWVKENLRLDYPATIIDYNGDQKNYEDLRLMSACKHHIIGNSTFSWWGAWLGKKSGQLVYAPKRYHMKDNIETTDLYPISWQLIDIPV